MAGVPEVGSTLAPVKTPPLDICTVFASGPSRTEETGDAPLRESDQDTGEVLDGAAQRLRRWELQRAARLAVPAHRVRICLRHRLPRDEEGVRVYRREDRGTYYAGLMTCGSVWACPVCAAKVSERRRQDLRAAVARWRERGGDCLMLTLTVPHRAHMEAFGLVDKLMRAVKRLNSGRNALAGLVPGYAGQVRALEVTHGEHGWHPHLHVLLFVDAPLGAAFGDVWIAVYLAWAHAVEAVGLERPRARAFNLQDGAAAADYVAKYGHEPRWGAAEEVTKAAVKQSRSSAGRTPFALLADAAAGDDQAASLFREFVKAFAGKRPLRWSPGLRDLLGMTAEKTGEEEAAAVDASDELLARISDEDWSKVCRLELRGAVLELLRDGTVADLERFLSNLRAGLLEHPRERRPAALSAGAGATRNRALARGRGGEGRAPRATPHRLEGDRPEPPRPDLSGRGVFVLVGDQGPVSRQASEHPPRTSGSEHSNTRHPS